MMGELLRGCAEDSDSGFASNSFGCRSGLQMGRPVGLSEIKMLEFRVVGLGFRVEGFGQP